MENTPENKEKFMTQYWGQNLVKTGVYQYKVDSSINLKHPDFYLELTPLISISDEDVKHLIGELYEGCIIYKIEKEGVWTKVKIKWDWKGKTKRRINYIFALELENYQYLQSKGYSLPWMGLSINQLIEYGWVKLKE